ncbi:1,4-alpha-glucan branching protein GlgB [Allorhodopirellula heiligendammensis]|uniref:1,4-alpha-glucan branching enzyme GlgB n=1 Tax=Allorhodopirellula heiligendammensis TaxID=2714739 RepID=A0A5C6C3X3_9BACT|nr:1,4-alpha-glucan branching protein GlgB [Allorhodopirellula heiligendammensis]TWU18311.1 1,4-alpha-glucan branching enzyme GlgB [Allorhodopirellula heiligendammensis]
MNTQLTLSSIQSLLDGSIGDPSSLLGRHSVDYRGTPATAIRMFQPEAHSIFLIDSASGMKRPMRRLHPEGVFEAILDETPESNYKVEMIDRQGNTTETADPYATASLLSDFDRYLIGQGRHHRIYERLGAQLRTVNGVPGVNFAVWAPNARAVQVVGDFNGWDGRQHAARQLPHLGIWEIFVPAARVGQRYKFRIHNQHGHWMDKCDPMAFASELPPLTANIITDINSYQWSDSDWMNRRSHFEPLHAPMNVYEVHLGSWQKGAGRTNGWLDYRDLARRLADYCIRMNFTHVELMPISEHPYSGSWGYQSVGYYAPTSRHGKPEDFMFFVDHLHQHGIGVIVDWVPAHFPKDDHGLRRFDGSPLYEHADPRQGEHPDWGTMIFNFGRNEVKNFLIANAVFWLDKYHIDGLRVDAVASMLYLDYSRNDGEWVPNRYGGRENLESIDFLREFNDAVHENFPGVVTAAEESTAWPGVSKPTSDGGLGFTYKWNMGWMNDTLRYMRNEPIHRQYHQNELTFSLIYAFTENFMLPLSHDEVVHGKGSLISQMPGDIWQKFANLRLLYSYMWTHPGKKLLFMGGELAQWNEWNEDDGPQWLLLDFATHRGIQQLISDLNLLVNENPALHHFDFGPEGFEWVDCQNAKDSTLVYLRKGDAGHAPLLVCCNFTPVVREGYPVGVPESGFWKEVFNSDSEAYGGSNVGNYPGCQTRGIGHHERPDSIAVTLPPLGTTIFRLEQ